MRVETESKYYCIEPEKLIDQCEKLGLKRVKYITEDDEYFRIYCYDKDGTVLDSFSVAFTDIGVKCKTSDFTYIPIDTAYLNIKKM
jgi:hypothetical protein